jgi:argininosuccinate lyase
MGAMLSHTTVRAEVCNAAAADPQLLATDLADYLVGRGVAFRQAHHLVGAVVAFAERKGCPLDRVTVAELRTISDQFGDDVGEIFNLKRAMARRTLTGSPGTREVARQLKAWRRRLGGTPSKS